VEDEEGRRHQTRSGSSMVPVQTLAEVEGDEDAENDQRDDLLDHLELYRTEAVCAQAVGRHLEAILE